MGRFNHGDCDGERRRSRVIRLFSTICRVGTVTSLLVVGLVIVAGGGTLAGAVTTVTSGTTVTDTYNYTGSTETLTVPANVTQITMTVTGAEGGQGGRDASGTAPPGGYQGVVTGTITVTPGEVLTIGVGQGGADSPDWNVCTGGSNYATGDPNDAVGGINPLGGYGGGAGGSPGASGCSGYGGSGGAASVVEIGTNGAPSSVATIVAGGSGGSGGSGQYAPTLGQISVPNYIARPDQTSTTGQYGESVYSACHQVSGEQCDGGGGAGGGGGAQGGSAGLVEFGSGTSDEWFGLGGYPGESSTGGLSGLSSQYDYYSNDNANGSVVLSYSTGAPGAPTSVNGTPGNTNVALYWTAPTSTGSASISGYSVQYAVSPYSSWTSAPECSGTTTTCTVTGLTNGTAYEFEVAATNAVGTGGFSSPSGPITPSGPPSAPNITMVTPSDGSLTLAFSPAGSNLPITDYQYSLDGGTTWVSGGVTASPLTISGLTNGTLYSVALRGVSATGGGASSSPATGTPSALPGAPTISSITPGGDGVSLKVAFVPGYTGGSAIQSYQYATSVGAGTTAFGAWTTATGTTSPITISGLINGTSYSVELRAVNANGAGPGSVYQVGVTLTVASAPTITTVTPSDSALAVTYAPFTSASDGGSAISGIDYSLDGGTTWTSAGTLADPFTIPSLTNGTTYSVIIRADNGVGSGPSSAPASGTPYALPGAPVNVHATGAAASSQVAWSAPVNNGGSAITIYTASAFTTLTGGSAVATCSSSSLSCVISGLTNDTTYYVSVTATNAAGMGPASNPRVSSLPVALPGPPTLTALTAGDAFLSVPFTAGTQDSNNPITGYQYSTDGGVTWLAATGSTSPITVSNLTNGTAYSVELRATSADGPGAASNAEPGTPYAAPDPTANATTSYVAGSGQVTVTWVAPNSNGAAISSYTVTAFSAAIGGTQITTCTTSTLSCTLSGLSNGTTYYISIQSVNVHTEYSLRSSPRILVVPGIVSTTSLAASPTSSTYGASVTLTATVTSGATGTVNFEVGGTSIAGCAAVTISSSTAQCITTALPTGTDSLQALYAGNSTYASSQSSAANYVVAVAAQSALTITSTSTTFTLSPSNTATLGITGGTTGGVVTYVVSGSENSAGCSVSGAVLTYTSGGTCTVTATMAGNTNYAAVSSTATTFTVNLANSTTSLGAAPTSSTYDASVTLTATVTSGATGTVNFEVGGTSIAGCGAVALVTGVAHCVTTALPEGSDSLEALYSGDGSFNSSHSATAPYSVGHATQATLVVTTMAGTIGIDLTLGTSGGSGSGGVTYVVANGSATCSQPSPGVLHASGAGTCLVTATKAGDSDYASTSSTATTVTFSENQTLVFTTTPPSSAFVNSSYTPSATSSANLSVVITIDGSSASICTITAGVVSFTAAGSCVIDANQSGEGNILPATQIDQTITVIPAVHHNAPSAPIDVAGASATGGVEVTWSPPSSSGTSAITAYDVTAAPGGASCTSATTSCVVTGLVAGTSYTLSVVAINATGDSPAGTATFSFAPAPQLTLGDVAVAADGASVIVSWSAPTGTAHREVAGYVVTLEPGGQQCTTTTLTTCSFDNVPMASEYIAKVTVLAASGTRLGTATGRAALRVVAIAHFTFDSFALTARDRRALGRLATMVVRTKVHSLSLFGYTDVVGGAPYNAALSRERAVAVGRYLTMLVERRGYHGLAIREIGKGVLRNGESRAQNRKVTVFI